MIIPNIWENNPNGNQTTNQVKWLQTMDAFNRKRRDNLYFLKHEYGKQ